jgi:hypothetical protein
MISSSSELELSLSEFDVLPCRVQEEELLELSIHGVRVLDKMVLNEEISRRLIFVVSNGELKR